MRTRRSLLAGGAAVVCGCLGSREEDEEDGVNEEEGDEGGETGRDGELDLREANVVSVSVEEEGGAYTFDVTLYHDDAGEDGYADRWVVESLDGDEVGRRSLAHPHGTRRFTRSATVSTEEDCVVVRGHDRTHGYGGRAVVVSLSTGETRGFAQGEEPSSFDEGDCP
jgi:hypothetical protein